MGTLAKIHKLRQWSALRRKREADNSRKVEITAQGRLLTVKHGVGVRPVGGYRGEVKMFTKASRLRMFKLMACVDWDAVPGTLFLTLTYPDGTLINGKDIERDRAELVRRLERRFGQMPAIWRVEWIARKSGSFVGEMMPHMHWLLPGAPFLPWEELMEMWAKVLFWTGYVDVDTKWLKDYRGVVNYVAKYVGKVQAESANGLLGIPAYSRIAGRHWGVIRRNLLPMCASTRLVTTDRRVVDAVHGATITLSRYVPHSPEASYTIFHDAAEEVVQKAIALDASIKAEYDTGNL